MILLMLTRANISRHVPHDITTQRPCQAEFASCQAAIAARGFRERKEMLRAIADGGCDDLMDPRSGPKMLQVTAASRPATGTELCCMVLDNSAAECSLAPTPLILAAQKN
jgi:hypothetical protein